MTATLEAQSHATRVALLAEVQEMRREVHALEQKVEAQVSAAQLEAVAAAHYETRLLRKFGWAPLLALLHSRRRKERKAQAHHTLAVMSAALSAWRSVVQRHAVEGVVFDAANAQVALECWRLHLLRSGFQGWRGAAATGVAERFAGEQRLAWLRKRTLFRAWMLGARARQPEPQ